MEKNVGTGLKIGQVLQYFAVHFVGAEGFVQEAVESVVLEVLVHILVYGGGEGDCGDVLVDTPDLFQQGFPVHQRHFKVDEQQVEGAAAEKLPGDFAVLGGLDGGAPAMEEATGDIEIDGIVFYEEDVDAGELFERAEPLLRHDDNLRL